MPQQPAQHETQTGEWVRHRVAAEMMGVNEKYLRPDRSGKYPYFPNLRRIRPEINGRPSKFIYLLRTEVLAWKAEQEAQAVVEESPTRSFGSAFENLRETFAGKPNLLRSLGLS